MDVETELKDRVPGSESGFLKDPANPPSAGAVAATGTALATMGLDDDGSTGFENTKREEQTTPGLRIIQSNSPQVDPEAPEYNSDAKQGMILNTSTGELYDGKTGVELVVFGKDHHYRLWRPRDLDGGGFRGTLPTDHQLVRDTLARMSAKYGQSARFRMPKYRDGKWSDTPARHPDTEEDVELTETGQLFVLYSEPELNGGNARPAFIALSSTMMPVYTGYVDRHLALKHLQRDGVTRREAKAWAYRWRLTTVRVTKGNNSWYIFKLDPVNGKLMESLTAVHDVQLFEQAQAANADLRRYMVAAEAELQRQPGEDPDDPPM